MHQLMHREFHCRVCDLISSCREVFSLCKIEKSAVCQNTILNDIWGTYQFGIRPISEEITIRRLLKLNICEKLDST